MSEPKTKTLTLFSPAKLNLFFRVLKKREDGFHEIASLMQAIAVGDHLHFEKANKDEITSDDPHLACDETNLVSKGVKLFRQKTKTTIPLRIHIEKNIPQEAGLGGGSSNLATTLWALNHLSNTAIPIQELKKWAGEISSDAPFFFSLGTAYSSGRGEIIQDLSPLPPQTLYLAKMNERLSTPHVYSHCKPHAISQLSPSYLLSEFSKGNFHYVNDLEKSAFNLKPQLKDLKEKLLSLGFSSVAMTGSGTAFFCFGDIKEPTLPGVTFTSSSFLSRLKNQWY